MFVLYFWLLLFGFEEGAKKYNAIVCQKKKVHKNWVIG